MGKFLSFLNENIGEISAGPDGKILEKIVSPDEVLIDLEKFGRERGKKKTSINESTDIFSEAKIPVLKQILSQVGTDDYDNVQIYDEFIRGFMLPDGQYLAIDQDHRYINGMVDLGEKLEEKFNGSYGGRTQKMFYIMKAANLIRCIPEHGYYFQIVTKPTYEQHKELMRCLKEFGQIEIEYGFNGKTINYYEEESYLLDEDLENKI